MQIIDRTRLYKLERLPEIRSQSCFNIYDAMKLLRVSHTAMRRMLKYWVEKAVEKDDLSEVSVICIDETSFKRGQSYVTVISDAIARRVIDVEDGRDGETVEKFSYKLKEKGGKCKNIHTFVSDMSAAFIGGKEICFPNAHRVFFCTVRTTWGSSRWSWRG